MTNNTDNTSHNQVQKISDQALSFSFGEPEQINSWADMIGTFYDSLGEYYSPPISPKGLDTLTRANGVHRRCINFKVNQMAIVFVQNGLMSLRDFRRCARDLESFGNFYIKVLRNGFKQITRVVHVPALNMRKGKNNKFKMIQSNGPDVEFVPGEILHGFHYDTGQDIYGIPEWIGSLHDAFLNSEATLFRRRYYKNGSHLGYILYTSDPSLDKDVEDNLRKTIAAGKGAGNFKSMFINIPNGKEKAVQIIPVGDISQKDEFERVKNISADDILISHGVQASLAGMKPDNVGGFGDIEKAERFYRNNEVRALVQPFLELNDELEGKRFEFDFKINTATGND